MEKITYGCMNGLIDWEVNIRVGRANIKVHFTGGAMTCYGVTPAEYTTDNKFFQRAIEGSEHFKNGTIRVLRKVEVCPEGSVQIKASAKEEAPAPEDLEEVHADCLQDAQEYLRDKFGVPTYKVTSKSKAESYGRSHGVTFKWE